VPADFLRLSNTEIQRALTPKAVSIDGSKTEKKKGEIVLNI
jgi:hypothetical protein